MGWPTAGGTPATIRYYLSIRSGPFSLFGQEVTSSDALCLLRQVIDSKGTLVDERIVSVITEPHETLNLRAYINHGGLISLDRELL